MNMCSARKFGLIRDVATESEAVEKRLRRAKSLERVRRVCNVVSMEVLCQYGKT